jgi:hypothetical protein
MRDGCARERGPGPEGENLSTFRIPVFDGEIRGSYHARLYVFYLTPLR